LIVGGKLQRYNHVTFSIISTVMVVVNACGETPTSGAKPENTIRYDTILYHDLWPKLSSK